jgi:hypothetical protein
MLLTLPEEEDWSFLRDESLRTDPFDPIKYVPLGQDGAYASFGGEVRYFYEAIDNENLGRVPGWDGSLKQRYRGHVVLHLSENVRVFAEVQSALIDGRRNGPRPSVDRDELDLLSGFVELRSSAVEEALRAPAVVLRLGRQQLDFGAGRLISSREGPSGSGPNALQSFHGARLILRRNLWRLDLFATRPVFNARGVFDNEGAPDESASGAYLLHGGMPGTPVPGYEVYYIRTERPDAVFFAGTADETRHSVGVRAFRKNTPLDYDVEIIHQSGRFGRRDIDAWGVSTDIGYTVATLPWTPRLGFRTGLQSGGANADELKTFYVPFPRGVYFGNLSPIGPANAGGFEPTLTLHPTPRLTLMADSFFFWRQDRSDGVYTLAGFPLAPPTGRERYIGTQYHLEAEWRLTDRLTLSAAFELFKPGAALDSATAPRLVQYIGVWANFRF